MMVGATTASSHSGRRRRLSPEPVGRLSPSPGRKPGVGIAAHIQSPRQGATEPFTRPLTGTLCPGLTHSPGSRPGRTLRHLWRGCGWDVLLLLVLMLSAVAPVAADEPLKVTCASRVDKAPKVDGVLDDACWAKTEVRTDFTSPASGAALKRRSTMRFVFDDNNLYMGLEFFWNDIEKLKKGIAAIVAKHGRPPTGVLPFKKYHNRYGVELFIDPGATQVNYYQILFNAAGQYTGNFKAIWSEFKGGHTVKSAVRGNCWTVEFVYPHKGIRAGDTWGLNVCRNDEDYYGIWKQVGGAYHAPKMFGRIVMGDYAQWWQAVWGKGTVARLADIHKTLPGHAQRHPSLAMLFDLVSRKARSVEAVARRCAPDSRQNFENLYRAYTGFQKDLDRLAAFWETVELMETEP
jgi:cellulose/xylan binding protein with CBM9 domain